MSTRLRICCLLGCLLGCYTSIAAPPAAVPKVAPAANAKQPEANQAKVDKIATALRHTPIYTYAIRSVAFHPKGGTLAIGTGDGIIRLWDLQKQDFAWIQSAHDNWVFDLNYAPDGTLVSGGGDNLVKLIDNNTGLITAKFEDHTNDLHGVAVTSDGKWLVSGGDDTRVVARAWGGENVAELGRHEKQVTSVTVSPNDRWAASSSRDSTIKLWDLQKLKVGQTIKGHTADVMSVTFSPDSSQLVSGGYDRTVRLWDASSGKQLKQFGFHDDWVFSVAFSKDGKFVFTGCGDDLVRMFRVSDGELIFKADLAADVSDMALSPDGRLLAAATSEGVVRLIAVDREKSKLLDESVRIPRIDPPLAPPRQPTVAEYLQVHQQLVQRGENWVEAMAGLSMSGDAFSLYLLRKINPQDLNAPDNEVLTKVIQQIEHRRRPEGDLLRLKEIGPMLHRAAVADLSCQALEGTLGPWLIKTLRAQSAEPAIREHLVQLRAKPPVPAGEDKQTWGAASERIQKYIDLILSEKSDDKPSKK